MTKDITIISPKNLVLNKEQWESFLEALTPLDEFCKLNNLRIVVTEFNINCNEDERTEILDLSKT